MKARLEKQNKQIQQKKNVSDQAQMGGKKSRMGNIKTCFS